MKQFIKTFIISLLIFSAVVYTGIFTYMKFFNPVDIAIDEPNENQDIEDKEEPSNFETPLERAMNKSKRINVLLVGLQGNLSDTIMLASYDREKKEANLISIPRDTYYYRKKYSKYSEFQKINAIYGSEENGQQALIDAVEDLTGVPIHKFVSVDYKGVKAAVDAVGGVEFNVPFHMKYTDPYDDPPLYIDISKGNQIIYGDDALELLRFRKGDPGYPGYPDGDVGRIKTQQEFIKAAIGKAMSLKLPSVISAVYPHVKTNFSLTDLVVLAKDSIGFSKDKLNSTILPGSAKYMGGLSFYLADGEEVTKLVYELYDVPLNNTENEVAEN